MWDHCGVLPLYISLLDYLSSKVPRKRACTGQSSFNTSFSVKTYHIIAIFNDIVYAVDGKHGLLFPRHKYTTLSSGKKSIPFASFWNRPSFFWLEDAVASYPETQMKFSGAAYQWNSSPENGTPWRPFLLREAFPSNNDLLAIKP